MGKAKLTGALLATAVGLLFTAQPPLADQNQSQPQAQVKCVGGNSCKGQSSCKSATNDCKGQNACKGKGFVMTASASECADKGGHVQKR